MMNQQDYTSSILDDTSDEALLLSAQHGDSLAHELLIRRYTRLVKSCARSYYLAGADEEDLLQEGMLGLLHAIRCFNSSRGTPFPAFAKLCVEHAIFSAVRISTSSKQEPLNSSLGFDDSQFKGLENVTDSGADPEREVLSAEAHRENLARLSSELSDFETKVLSLFLEGCSYEEMARKLDKSVKSVDNAIQRIKRKSAAIFS